MKVRILRSTVADGRCVYVGEIYDISDNDAKKLIQMGKAVAVVEEKIAEGSKIEAEKVRKRGGKR